MIVARLPVPIYQMKTYETQFVDPVKIAFKITRNNDETENFKSIYRPMIESFLHFYF